MRIVFISALFITFALIWMRIVFISSLFTTFLRQFCSYLHFLSRFCVELDENRYLHFYHVSAPIWMRIVFIYSFFTSKHSFSVAIWSRIVFISSLFITLLCQFVWESCSYLQIFTPKNHMQWQMVDDDGPLHNFKELQCKTLRQDQSAAPEPECQIPSLMQVWLT